MTGQRQPERQLSGMSTAELVSATKAELPASFRVYVHEWVHIARDPHEQSVKKIFQDIYAGRVHETDVRYQLDPEDEDENIVLYLKLWNVASEWKTHADAQGYIDACTADGLTVDRPMEVVARNSKREHELKSYSVLKLPDQ